MTSGTLATAGQHDWLAVSLVADQGYLFTVTGLDQFASVTVGPSSGLDDSVLLAASMFVGGELTPNQVFYEPATTGTYFLDISDNANTAGYSVGGTAVAVDRTDNAATTGAVTIGGPATTGTLGSAGQHDWLELSLVADQGYLFTITGLDQYASISAGPAAGLDESVQTGTPMFADGTLTPNEVFYEAATTGTYFLDISDTTNTASYSVTGTTVATDYADNATTTGAVTIGGAATKGTLSTAGQHDWLRLSLVANQGYVFTVNGLDQYASLSAGPAGGLDESVLLAAPVFPGGTVTVNQLFYEAATTGTYFLDITDESNVAPFSVTGTAVATDFADNASTKGAIAIGGAAETGTLGTAGQHDWLRVSLAANQGYLFTVTGLDQYAGLSAGPAAGLDDSVLVETPPFPGGTLTTGQVFYEAATAGTYYLDISDEANVASYSVTGAAVTTDYTDNAATGGVVTIGGPATTGTLGTVGQHDWLALSLAADQGYLFTVTGLDQYAGLSVGPAGGLDDSVLVAAAPLDGGTVTTNQVFYEAATAGTYYLDISDEGGTAQYSVTGATVATDYADNATTSGAVTACFAAGTRIATARGAVPVEQLRRGDLIRRHRDGFAPVVWLGHRKVACARHPRPDEVWPVRVCRDAFGPGRPHRELWLSPDHSVFVDGVLIPIRLLVNGASVAQMPRDEVTYWHVELPVHDVVLAEGLPCESYLDTGNRMSFANGGRQVALHPQFAALAWQDACAPLCLCGLPLQAARAALLARLPALGYRLAADDGFHVAVDGRILPAARVIGALHRFLLPARARAIQVMSASSVPAGLDPGLDDVRALGVRVDGVSLDGRRIPLDSHCLQRGFHPPEGIGSGMWRWTSGAATIALCETRQPRVLDLLVGKGSASFLKKRSKKLFTFG